MIFILSHIERGENGGVGKTTETCKFLKRANNLDADGFSRSAPYVSEGSAASLLCANVYESMEMKRPPTHINLSEHMLVYFADR